MSSRLAALCLSASLLSACSAPRSAATPERTPPEADVDTGTPLTTSTTPSDTGPVSTPGPLAASCSLQDDNPLRMTCRVTTTQAETVRVIVTETATGQSRVWRTVEAATEATVRVGLLPPDSPHTWRVEGEVSGALAEGALSTGALPAAGAYTVLGERDDPRSDHLLVPMGCGVSPTLTVVDGHDRVVWLQSFPESSQLVAAVATERGSFVALLDENRLVEVTYGGEVRLDLDLVALLDRPAHHDVSVSDGRIQVLTAFETIGSDGRRYVVDGVALIDPDGTVAGRWDLTDWLEPSGGPTDLLSAYWFSWFPGALDWSHANTVQPGPPGTMLVSFRHLHTVVQVRSDPEAPDFGVVDWWLSSPRSVVDGGLILTAAPELPEPHDFAYQHHATLDDTGRLLLFDNRDSLDGLPSRALALSLDTRTAHLEQTWTLPDFCPFQGGAVALGDERVLVTCAQVPYALELGADGTIHRHFEPACPEGWDHASRILPWVPPEEITVP